MERRSLSFRVDSPINRNRDEEEETNGATALKEGRGRRQLYVCLQTICGNADWYTLCRKPDKSLKTRSSGYALARVPVPSSPPSSFRNLVAVGSNIYNIATPTSLNAFPRFSIRDRKYHTWI
ncbi:hypothetical protein YC2023_072767 [Brassica napus]